MWLCVVADSVPWPSAGERAFPAGRQHWCPHLQTTPPHHTAQCQRTQILSWCSFAAMSMTSAMAASSRTPSSSSSCLRSHTGAAFGESGPGVGVLLEAQHLVKGHGMLACGSLGGGGRAGPLWILGHMGEREART